MKSASRPIRTTILVGGLGALVWLLGDLALGWHWARPTVRFGMLWLLTAGYALLLVRWSRRGLVAVIFPLMVLGLWGWYRPHAAGTLMMAAAVLSWVRSGVCFPAPLGRALMREALLCGGGLLAVALVPASALSGAVGVWLFFLVQALFFVVVETAVSWQAAEAIEDPFERSRRRAEQLLVRY